MGLLKYHAGRRERSYDQRNENLESMARPSSGTIIYRLPACPGIPCSKAREGLTITLSPRGEPVREETFAVVRNGKDVGDSGAEGVQTLKVIFIVAVFEPNLSCTSQVEDHISELDRVITFIVDAHSWSYSSNQSSGSSNESPETSKGLVSE